MEQLEKKNDDDAVIMMSAKDLRKITARIGALERNPEKKRDHKNQKLPRVPTE